MDVLTTRALCAMYVDRFIKEYGKVNSNTAGEVKLNRTTTLGQLSQLISNAAKLNVPIEAYCNVAIHVATKVSRTRVTLTAIVKPNIMGYINAHGGGKYVTHQFQIYQRQHGKPTSPKDRFLSQVDGILNFLDNVYPDLADLHSDEVAAHLLAARTIVPEVLLFTHKELATKILHDQLRLEPYTARDLRDQYVGVKEHPKLAQHPAWKQWLAQVS